MILTKHNPTISIGCAVVLLLVASGFTFLDFHGKPLDRSTFALMVIAYIFGLGILLRELLRKRGV